MRSLFLLLALAACTGSDETDTVDETDTSDASCTEHPLIPEDKACLWAATEDGCTTGEAPANQLRYLFEGEIDADGNFSGVETVWWFFPMPGFEDDCIDRIEVTGRRLYTDPSTLGCAGCEEVYEVDRVKIEDNCAMGYSFLFPEDQDGLHQTLLLDTMTANGEPQDGGNVLVMHREPGQNGVSTREYARGTYTPLGAEHAPPATIAWEGARCRSR